MTPEEITRYRGALTQVEFAKAMGVSVGSLRNWEQGVTPVPAMLAKAIEWRRLAVSRGWRYALVENRQVQFAETRVKTIEQAILNAGVEWYPRDLLTQVDEPGQVVYCFPNGLTRAIGAA